MIAMAKGKRTEQVLIRLTPEEHERVTKEAERAERKMADFARLMLFDGIGNQYRVVAVDGRPVDLLHLAPSADEPRERHVTTFPVVAYASAGAGREPSEMIEEEVQVVNTLAREALRKHWKFVKVIGDSMETSLYDGDIVAIEPTQDLRKVRPRETVYCLLNGDPQIKELHMDKAGKRMVLVPVNTLNHSPIPILEGDTLELIGIVRELARRAHPTRR